MNETSIKNLICKKNLIKTKRLHKNFKKDKAKRSTKRTTENINKTKSECISNKSTTLLLKYSLQEETYREKYTVQRIKKFNDHL